MKLTLTIDNGPEPHITDQVLDVLEAAQVKAAFFLVGSQLQRSSGGCDVRRMLRSGHVVGNHSLTHTTPLGRLSDEQKAVAEISVTQTLLEDLGVGTRFFRPFGGGGKINRELLHPAAARFLMRERFTCVLWNSVPRDWEEPTAWTDRALADLGTRPWTVLVIHDKANGAMNYLFDFIQCAKALGAEFTTEFPRSCTPIVAGVPDSALAKIVST